jgi:bifunctional non-homologous end joining protein LigD
VTGQGAAFHREACRQQLEGIVSKRADSLYAAGRRTREWVKVKCSARQELVIGGFTEPKGSRHGLGALLLGVHENGALRYAGRVGTGFSHELLTRLRTRLERLATRTPPFANPPRASRDVHWVKPTLVAEAGFLGWTKDGLLRHPTFLGLREDKPAREAVRETPRPAKATRARTPATSAGAKNGAAQVAGVAITHPDKVLYPEEKLTKLELAGYLEAVAPRMLPEIAHRPVMLLRCPGGREGACFFQKHPADSEPDSIDRVQVRGSKRLETYMAVHDAQGLVTLLQLGALEIHVFGVRADRPEQPDRVVFDLDPSPRSPWTAVIETAQRIRERLEGLNLVSYLKTTGGKGLHVVAPIRRGPGWDEVKAFATGIAAGLIREDPKRLTTHLAKAKRGDRIFVDALRNGPGASWVAPWSPRAREGAPISMPIPWSELTERLRPDAYTVRRVLRDRRLLARNPWRSIEPAKQTITAAMLREISARQRSG